MKQSRPGGPAHVLCEAPPTQGTNLKSSVLPDTDTGQLGLPAYGVESSNLKETRLTFSTLARIRSSRSPLGTGAEGGRRVWEIESGKGDEKGTRALPDQATSCRWRRRFSEPGTAGRRDSRVDQPGGIISVASASARQDTSWKREALNELLSDRRRTWLV